MHDTKRLRRQLFREVVASMEYRAGLGAPIRDELFRSTDPQGETVYPMAGLMNSRGGTGGGRGGKTRLLLYLTLLWVASGGDHSSTRPASFWATLLGLPPQDGERVIWSTWEELARRGFVRRKKGVERNSSVRIWPLREDGSRRLYTLPTGAPGDTYFRVPEEAWRLLFHDKEVTGPSLVMYLTLLRLSRRVKRLDGLVLTPSQFREECGMGESTRKSGLHTLDLLGVVQARKQKTDFYGSAGQRGQRRNLYDLDPDYFPVL